MSPTSSGLLVLHSPPRIVERQPCRNVPAGSFLVVLGDGSVVTEVPTREEAEAVVARLVLSA